MKIGILTYYGVHNHGALLQANALKTVLESKGHDCGFLEFKRDYSNIGEEQSKKYEIGLGSILFYTKYLFNKGVSNIFFNLKKKSILEDYRSSHIPMLGAYDTFNGDLIIIGSDEVFSLEIGINPFLYGNSLNSKHIGSYAGCFGPTTFDEIKELNQVEMISSGLNKMDAISVRDMNSQKVIENLIGVDVPIVCDPVILYGYKEEMNRFNPKEEKYILIYSYDKNMNERIEYDPILKYAESNGLKIFSIGYHHKWCKSINVTPDELLGWINHAELVITDTFHGTVMSIICNTPVAIKLRGNHNKLKFLLMEYNLLDRTLESFKQLNEVAANKINFNEVNKKINERRKFSMDYLDSLLEKCNKS